MVPRLSSTGLVWVVFFLLASCGLPGVHGDHNSVRKARDANDRDLVAPLDNDADDDDPRCTNVDIRNDLRRLADIENCTVIRGFLQMVLLDRVPASEFEKYSFPKLREVTGYMLFFRVIHLSTLRRLFPQLAVIRGQQLIGNYALVFYYMENMIEVGLKNLIAIQRGFVYTLHCPQLCHLDTIDWAAITGLDNSTKNLNSFETPKSVCNKFEVCRFCEPKFCWGSESCQKFYKGYNFSGRIKCHEQCIGGCTGKLATQCNVCRSLKEGKKCVPQCSVDRLMFRPTKRCVTKETCLNRGGLLFKDECVLECPAGYSTTNVDQEQADFSIHQCYPCQHRCPKVCDGTEIMYLSDADRMRGCTIVNGTLHIRLTEDHPNLLEELRNGLGDIEEIMGILKVFRSNYISSLEFLTNLEIIHGQYTTDNSNFSLMVYENSNLQRLWNFEHKTSLRFLSGSMYFRNNELLCNSHIKLLRKIAEYDNASDTIDWNSNGYMQACHVQPFLARSEVLSSRNVTIYWSIHSPKTHHRVQGYLIYFIRTKVDKSPYEGRDVCSKFGWKMRYVSLENVSIEGSFYAYNLTRLKPYTRYGFYVKAYYNESFNSATDLVGMSNMQYFKTAKDRPTSPLHVRTARKSDHSITLSWQILESEKEMVIMYHVDVFIQPDEPAKFDQRNYCIHPHEPRPVHHDQTVEGCNEETCCCQEYEFEKELEEDDEDDDDELTAPDDFFNEQPSIEDGGGRIGGRRKKRSTNGHTPDKFELSMLKLLKETNAAEDHNARRARREASDKIVFVNRVVALDFTTDNFEFTVPGLNAYTRYVFQLFACSTNDTVYCSAYSLYSDRTNASPYADRLNVSIETEMFPVASDVAGAVNGTTTSLIQTTYDDRIVLHFPEPTKVNGLTVAYRVEMEAINGTYLKRRGECFTRLQHELNHHRFTLLNVSPGEYLVRAQAVSLAGPGPFTEWLVVRVLEPPPSTQSSANTELRDGLITLAVLFALGVALGLLYLCRHRMPSSCRLRRVTERDDKIPLAINDGNQINFDDGFVNCPLK
ncbi:insulin-like peptide receptor [Anopheles marshallii]|uniref:insulin-like peptide receptor n=1 Tax=Anopheles marshallii TaxID=1521116 RepID=UPI00237A7D95|nr:insulin-like peptide receptor [Anopheles marshallii]